MQWSIQRIPHHCTYLTMNKKRLLQMQFNIKVRTTIAWQKAQHQKYSSTTIAYWKTHIVFAYLTSGALWSSFGSLQSSSLLFFAPKDDDDVLPFLLSVNSFLENPMHLPWVCCCSTGILKDPHFYQPHLTVDAPLDYTPHATDTSIMTRLKKQA